MKLINKLEKNEIFGINYACGSRSIIMQLLITLIYEVLL